MRYPSSYAPETVADVRRRLTGLRADTVPRWGKMNAAQMLAHLNVAYDMETGALPVQSNFLTRWLLKTFVKKQVVGPKPYPRNGRTAPQFVIADERDFEAEKTKLLGHLRRVQENGARYYEGRENVSFGPLTAAEWDVMYQKHLDHHFGQFGI